MNFEVIYCAAEARIGKLELRKYYEGITLSHICREKDDNLSTTNRLDVILPYSIPNRQIDKYQSQYICYKL